MGRKRRSHTIFGDLNDHYGFHEIKPGLGGFFRLHFTPYISMRTSLLFTQVGYADRYNSNEYQRQRNLSFQSNIVEASVQAEFISSVMLPVKSTVGSRLTSPAV